MKNNNELQMRSVARIINSTETVEGAGFTVHRPFPTEALLDFDPFLLLDEMGPMQLAPTESTGAPDHPHRGFETVTYMLSGHMEHKDSQGNQGSLNPGDVQWMTAGSGVIHSELTAEHFNAAGGTLHGLQLWVNLPKADKMMPPRYQDIAAEKMPVVKSADGLVEVKVIAGESLGAKAVIDTRTPMMYLHLTIQPGGTIMQSVPAGFNAFAYIIEGSGTFDAQSTIAQAQQMVIFDNKGDSVTISNQTSETLSVLLIGGQPLGEPVARYGPFVMNTESEIHQALRDYRSGRFGEITI